LVTSVSEEVNTSISLGLKVSLQLYQLLKMCLSEVNPQLPTGQVPEEAKTSISHVPEVNSQSSTDNVREEQYRHRFTQF